MSIVAGAGTTRGPRAPIGPASSPLDRVLKPLAGTGEAIRAEIALNTAPVTRELEAANERIASLETRVRELESALSAKAPCNHPSPDPVPPMIDGEPPLDAETTPRDVAPAKSMTRDVDTVRREVPDPATEVPAPDQVACLGANPTVPAEAPLRNSAPPNRRERPQPASGHRHRKRRRATPTKMSSEPVAAESGPDAVPTNSQPDSEDGKPGEVPEVGAARDPAAGILNPVLEAGARNLIALGRYRDLTDLLNEAVYRLLEADHPADPGG